MSLNKSLNVNVQGNENTQVDVNVIVGKSYEYNDLLDKLMTQQELFELTPENKTQRRLEISAKINDLTNQIEQFKQDVLKLAEAFQNIEVNTERLQRAKEFFDKGEIGEARAVLETELEQMQSEQKHLLREREHYESETLPKLQNNSEEFYLLALSIQADYANPNRFDDTCQHFKSSIESYPTKSNVFANAKFLQEHNQFAGANHYYNLYLEKFKNEITENEYATTLNNLAVLHSDQNNYDEALKEFDEALLIRRQLAAANPNACLPYVAGTLNNLAILHKDQNNYDEALKEYEEALQIYQQLAAANPNAYLPDVATTLNNLAILHKDQNNYDEALKEYEEALQIYRQLAAANPNAYLPDVATTLNNLAVLHSDQNNYDEALKEFDEALLIRRQLAAANPNACLPDVAMTLNNLAILHQAQNNFDEALKEFDEALLIYRQLAAANPNTYLPDIATTLNNLAILREVQNNFDEALKEYEEALQIRKTLFEKMPEVYAPDYSATLINVAIFYQDAVPEREKSVGCAVEAVMILTPIVEKVPYTQKYMGSAMYVLKNWGLNIEEIQQLVDEKIKEILGD